MGVEGQAYNLSHVALQGVHALAILRVPDFRGLIEGTCGNEVPEGVVKAEAVDNILVASEGQKLFSGGSVPDLTGFVVTSGDEFVSIFIKGAVSKGLHMCLQSLKQAEFLLFVGHHFVNKFWG